MIDGAAANGRQNLSFGPPVAWCLSVCATTASHVKMNPAVWEEGNKNTPSSLSGSLSFANDCACVLNFDDIEGTGTLRGNHDTEMSILPPPIPQDALPPSGRRKWRNKFQQRHSNNKNNKNDASKNDAHVETMVLAKEQAPPLQLKNKKPVVVSISAADLAAPTAPMAILPRAANGASGGQSHNRPKKSGGQKKHNKHKGGRGGQRGRGKAVHHRTRDAPVPTHIGGGGQGGQYAHPPVENLELPSSLLASAPFDPYHSAYGQHQAPLDSVSSGSTSDEAQTASYSSHGHGQFGHGWYAPYYGVPPHHMHGQYGAFYNNGTVYYPYPFGFPCYDYSHYSYCQHQGATGADAMGDHADPHRSQGQEK